MNKVRAILSGALVWAFVVTSFLILSYVPALKDSLNQQALVVGLLIIPFATIGAFVYYKKGDTAKGMHVGIVMVLTALILDALITVPFIEIPNGGSYRSFYGYPLLWMLVAVNVATVYVYWRRKVNRA